MPNEEPQENNNKNITNVYQAIMRFMNSSSSGNPKALNLNEDDKSEIAKALEGLPDYGYTEKEMRNVFRALNSMGGKNNDIRDVR